MEIHDPLTYPQVIAYQQALSAVRELLENGKEPSLPELHFALLPGILPCIAKFKLKNFPKKVTAENFPASPAQQAGLLMDWLREEVLLVYSGATEEVPKES